MPGFTPEAEAALRASLQKTFEEFDADKSGEVSTDEIKTMMTSLGLLIEPDKIAKMMEEADEDKSGEIDFEEFYKVMKKAAEGGPSTGPFAALVNRKANNGPAIMWRKDKKGTQVELMEDARKVKKQGEQWGVQLLDMYLKVGNAGDCYDASDILLEATTVSGECYVGLVGPNFEGSWPGEKGDPELKSSQHAIAGHFAVDTPGEMFRKKQGLGNMARLCKLSSGNVFQIEINMKKQEARFTILDSLEANNIISTVIIDGLLSSMCLAVGFGPVADGKQPFEFTILGTSCEKTPAEEMELNETESAEKQAARNNPAAAAAMAMA